MARMVIKRRSHAWAFKREAVARMKSCADIKALAKELGINRRLLYDWKDVFEGKAARARGGASRTAEERKEQQLTDEIRRLKLSLAEKTLENDFFEAALLRTKGTPRNSTGSGTTGSTRSSSRGRMSKAESE